MTTVLQAIREVMLAVPSVAKADWNNQSSYAFRGVDAVVDAVGPALRTHGVIVVPELVSAEYTPVTVGKNRTEMSSVRLQVKFTWYGPDGDSITCCVAGEAFDSGDKATAKAHSVAYRTALIEVLCLATGDRDPDKDSYKRSGPVPVSPASAARDELRTLLRELDIDPEDAIAKFAADGNGDLGQSESVVAIKRLTAYYRNPKAGKP